MKSIWASKTIWFNIIMTLVTVATALQGLFPEWAPILGTILVIGNVILRIWFTEQPIG